MRGTARISAPLAAAALTAMIAAPAAAQVLKVTPDFATRATSLIGHTVTDPQGHPVGRIDDLLIRRNGEVGFVVLSAARALGIGSKLVAVPYGQVSAKGEKLFFNGTPDELKNATPFSYDQHAMIDVSPGADRGVEAGPPSPTGAARQPAAAPAPPPARGVAPGAPTPLLPPSMDRAVDVEKLPPPGPDAQSASAAGSDSPPRSQ